jgi:hypothetical protein
MLDERLATGPAEDLPQIRPGHAIAEAFPNCFLGVAVADAEFERQPSLARGKKFDWLYERWIERGLFRMLADEVLAERCEAASNHHERGALVCLLTALCAYRGDYTCVGEATGGWFFLPPMRVWEPWAQVALTTCTRRLSERSVPVEVIAREADQSLQGN